MPFNASQQYKHFAAEALECSIKLSIQPSNLTYLYFTIVARKGNFQSEFRNFKPLCIILRGRWQHPDAGRKRTRGPVCSIIHEAKRIKSIRYCCGMNKCCIIDGGAPALCISVGKSARRVMSRGGATLRKLHTEFFFFPFSLWRHDLSLSLRDTVSVKEE